MHNLSTVFQFEVMRTLKKKTFWIMALVFPVAIAALFAIIYFAGKTTDEAALKTASQHFTIAVTDHSGLVNSSLLATIHASQIGDKQKGIDEVKNGQVDAYFYYPSDLDKHTVEIYAKDVGLFDNSRYPAVAQELLTESASANLTPQIVTVLQGKVTTDTKTYVNGQEADGIRKMIFPAVFLVLFFVIMSVFGNQMLTSTTEEKENRVIEMILTTIEARTLIIGKILSLIVLALVQIAIIMVPIIVAYLLFGSKLALPNIDLTNLPFDGVRVAFGAILFTLSFLFFTGLLVAIGAAAPTAKEAASFFTVILLMIMGPVYAGSLFVSAPDSPLVRFLTLFPFTAPIPLMLRNAVGNLSSLELTLGIAILAVSAALSLALAIRLFRYGALEYSRRLSLGEIFKRKA